MEAFRKRAVMEEDGQVTIRDLPYRKGEKVEVVVRKAKAQPAPSVMTVGDLLRSPLIGMWAGREDIRDSSEYAHELRQRAESREDR